ncbi:YqaA family protein [Acanthopleuribacter pedis]|uniref:DedA family protein n=1 Tax=Acanthopleuribacter pedis TaxID=442870 RepID=A0A8J7QF24_9BACT|nr:YqaA family protein [Acanthopleuribacter pedis]MBO1317200.1 DedA family protein [Acanthopleuribacter pedis]
MTTAPPPTNLYGRIMGWIRSLYDRTLALAEKPMATWWLALISFAESSFFPIPPDVMLMPMCLAQRDKAFRIAAICTVASVLGGLFGYALGYFFFEFIGQPILHLYGAQGKFETFQAWYEAYGSWVIFAAGVSPIPYKVITITAGVSHFSILPFIIISAISRGLRFFLVAGIVKAFGEPAVQFIDRYFDKLTLAAVILFIGGFVAIKFLLPA